GKLAVTEPARLADAELDRIDAFGLEGPVLHGQPRDQRIERADDAVLEIHDRELAENTAATHEEPAEHLGVPRFVGALPGEEHADLPRRIREVAEGARRALQ